MTLTSAVQVFLTGLAGGVVLELLHWYSIRRQARWPVYATRPAYWVITGIMALTGGLVHPVIHIS